MEVAWVTAFLRRWRSLSYPWLDHKFVHPQAQELALLALAPNNDNKMHPVHSPHLSALENFKMDPYSLGS